MNHNRVLCCRSTFDRFKKSSSEWVNKIPAENNDEFALLASVDQQGSVGFDKSLEGRVAIKALVDNCYYIDVDGKLQSLSVKELNYMPVFMLRDKEGLFEDAVVVHRKYANDLKKYEILSRCRDVGGRARYSDSFFAELWAFNEWRCIWHMKSTCHYVAISEVQVSTVMVHLSHREVLQVNTSNRATLI